MRNTIIFAALLSLFTACTDAADGADGATARPADAFDHPVTPTKVSIAQPDATLWCDLHQAHVPTREELELRLGDPALDQALDLEHSPEVWTSTPCTLVTGLLGFMVGDLYSGELRCELASSTHPAAFCVR